MLPKRNKQCHLCFLPFCTFFWRFLQEKWLNSKSRKELREARHIENPFGFSWSWEFVEFVPTWVCTNLSLHLSVSQKYLLFICSELRKIKLCHLLGEGIKENNFVNPCGICSFILKFLTCLWKTVIMSPYKDLLTYNLADLIVFTIDV